LSTYLQKKQVFSPARTDLAVKLLIWVITLLDWIQMHPKYVPIYILWENIPPPMGIAGSPDIIYQGKMSEHMESLEYVRAYSDDLLCISKSSREDHLE
jgi:hypothetical protein